MSQNPHNLLPCECLARLMFERVFRKACHKGGWLAKGLGDEKALAEALDRAMSDGEQRAHRGKLAAQSMVAFAPEAQFDRWAALLKSLITEHAS